ncbi:MAG: TIGR00282 family metallophosphoesterase [Clostridia bacterium]|nr:TIGR00282 family metallophosphoesterase [Clostridia bacterium]
MKILTIGDIVGKSGVEFLKNNLKEFKSVHKIDFVVANGENSAEGNGILPDCAKKIFESGVDVITNGNHTFRRREIFPFLNENHKILRPYNYPSKSTPGFGFCKVKVNNINVAVINLLGVAYLESINLPLDSLDEALRFCVDCPIKIVDFHAEATAEKRALGYYVDGKVSVVFGTHTHVQTSDEEILPLGTGYITDVGMTGPICSVLGVKKEISIKRMKNRMPVRFENATGPCKMECAVFEVDDKSGKTVAIERFRLK